MVNETTASWGVLVAGLWLAVTALSASTAGGYLAGRMRMPLAAADPNEREFRDGVHGLTVWAVSTVLALLVASLLAISASAGVTAASAAVTEIPENVARYARNGSVIIAFATAAAAALGAAAAWFSAEMGGKHRDDNINIGELVPAFMRKR